MILTWMKWMECRKFWRKDALRWLGVAQNGLIRGVLGEKGVEVYVKKEEEVWYEGGGEI